MYHFVPVIPCFFVFFYSFNTINLHFELDLQTQTKCQDSLRLLSLCPWSTSLSHPVLAFSVGIKLDLTVCPHLCPGSLRPPKLNKLARMMLTGWPRQFPSPGFRAPGLSGKTSQYVWRWQRVHRMCSDMLRLTGLQGPRHLHRGDKACRWIPYLQHTFASRVLIQTLRLQTWEPSHNVTTWQTAARWHLPPESSTVSKNFFLPVSTPSFVTY